MIEIMIQNIKGGISETKLPGIGFHQLLVAIIAGLAGFFTFFTTIILIKFFDNLLGNLSVFRIDTNDLLLSSIGFLCLFLISFLDNSSKKR
jgi:hypothetical protein